MQHPAVPELAHTHTRPIHWVATATAVAGVMALSSVLQPNSATAAQPADPTPRATHAAAPDPAGIDYPLTCGPVKTVVKEKATGDLDGDGTPETVAVVHCDAPMGTPPDGVYVITRSADGTPRVVATLVDPKDGTTVSDFSIRDGSVLATLLGYSTSDIPRCCPDVTEPARWQWKNGTFLRSTPAGAHTV
ncbi:hypothetical protein ELQ87_31470 [Streptomyces griseoviridis]|uniref:Secreted protein n=2 Tax=Streptomyces TaxID=1883 RepID=A0A3Q9L066_STRGD|nr:MULTISPECIES: hypothetical protein [Streptomyces]AZS88254.1 hypothetical protein ELQ87_31470 [Streptomyces griseoviridis]MDT0477300.1 hypothetical protein [Streptomyces sp. DSM 41014]QCN84903.1 hypothetical protein DDJ31_07795 [Streptomyces griseoviridis]